MELEEFCKKLPKIELHAHLNGSLSKTTLKTLQNIESNQNALEKYHIPEGNSLTLSECFEVFKIAHALTTTPNAVKLATSLTLQEFNDDGVVYLELRSTPRSNIKMTKTEYIQAMIDAVIETSKTIEMITCVIISIDRRNSLEESKENVDLAIEMAKKYPSIVVGLDLSGDPHAKTFNDFRKLLADGRSNGLKVAVHAAEIPSIEETFDILKWKPDRLGHVTCNSEITNGSEELWKEILSTEIPIEICLSSNVKSGTVSSYDVHHFKSLFEANHPISLATDDKGVFDTNLSKEFIICANTFNLDKEQLWELSSNAAMQIFSNDQVKKSLLNKLLEFKKYI